MSRSSYSDDLDEDFQGQNEFYRANVERSIRGKSGQARLTELRDALLALPAKRLEAEIFAEGTAAEPRVCALGAWALAKAGGNVEEASAMVSREADDYETFSALKSYGWPRLVVLEAIYVNDEAVYSVQTPEQRYAYVLNWVTRNISTQASSVL